MLELNKEQWAEWRNNPVTQHFFEVVKSKREEVIQRLAFGAVTEEKQQDISLGAVGAYTHILNVEFEE